MDNSVVNTIPSQDNTNINENIYNKTLPNFGNKVFSHTEEKNPEINDGNSRKANSTNWTLIIIFITLILILLIIIIILIKRYKKRSSNKLQSTYDLEIGNKSNKNTKGERI
ncbi:hypothetical protein BCR36DRAFT_415728 [Piromyces finnis]|uniref:Uncharacterized protein n=1 Tax=Piromyces finnis TaxID=1754191 RepID=A0A1Y1UXZ3_9FUNG|nr:hypothetical protein BCR36DRAFT_415728 [Piromyces finnis]|eukprot:ORX43104.1 hypothetical protein BCR36DRAFT_415728 [Piromyces finnis]